MSNEISNERAMNSRAAANRQEQGANSQDLVDSTDLNRVADSNAGGLSNSVLGNITMSEYKSALEPMVKDSALLPKANIQDGVIDFSIGESRAHGMRSSNGNDRTRELKEGGLSVGRASANAVNRESSSDTAARLKKAGLSLVPSKADGANKVESAGANKVESAGGPGGDRASELKKAGQEVIDRLQNAEASGPLDPAEHDEIRARMDQVEDETRGQLKAQVKDKSGRNDKADQEVETVKTERLDTLLRAGRRDNYDNGSIFKAPASRETPLQNTEPTRIAPMPNPPINRTGTFEPITPLPNHPLNRTGKFEPITPLPNPPIKRFD